MSSDEESFVILGSTPTPSMDLYDGGTMAQKLAQLKKNCIIQTENSLCASAMPSLRLGSLLADEKHFDSSGSVINDALKASSSGAIKLVTNSLPPDSDKVSDASIKCCSHTNTDTMSIASNTHNFNTDAYEDYSIIDCSERRPMSSTPTPSLTNTNDLAELFLLGKIDAEAMKVLGRLMRLYSQMTGFSLNT